MWVFLHLFLKLSYNFEISHGENVRFTLFHRWILPNVQFTINDSGDTLSENTRAANISKLISWDQYLYDKNIRQRHCQTQVNSHKYRCKMLWQIFLQNQI